MHNINEIKRFRDRYQMFSRTLKKQRFYEFRHRFGHLKSGYTALQNSLVQQRRVTGQGFNLFHLLDIARSELSHSRMLADLLNPYGSHAQGELFLKGFLALLQQRIPNDCILPAAGPNWRIRTEFWAGEQGRLDIVIEHFQEPKTIIVIENKIDAGLQADQLIRYANWLENYRSDYQSHLVYLTPTGNTPPDFHQPEMPVLCLSYNRDIAGWLADCVPHTIAPRVRESLTQYQNTVSLF